MADKCVDCGRRTSRGLKYCEACRRIHFTKALSSIRQVRPVADGYHGKPISTERREMRVFTNEGPARDGGAPKMPSQHISGRDPFSKRHRSFTGKLSEQYLG